MSDLGSSTPAATYAFLLQVDSGVDATTLRSVEDGDGTVTPLQVSEAAVAIDGDFRVLAGACLTGVVQTGNFTLTETSLLFQIVDTDTAAADVTATLPATPVTGRLYFFRNQGATYDLNIEDSGASPVTTFGPGVKGAVFWDGSAWQVW